MRFRILSVVLVFLALLLVACGGAEEVEEIVLYNWSAYIDPEIYTLFEEETGIRVREDNFSSNDEMLAELQGGAAGYSLVVPSDYTVGIMLEENLLARLNHDNLPNLENLAEPFRTLPFDPGNEYCVPYQWGTTGIGYNAAVTDEPASWAAIFEAAPDDLAYGRVTMLDDARESFAAALIYLGYKVNTTNEDELQEAKALLIQARPALSGFDSDNYEELVGSGENILAHGWNGDFLVAQDEFDDVAYVTPVEGSVIWVDNICIPSTASTGEQASAEKFINFLLSPEIGAMLSEYNYYASPNAAAEELLDEVFLEDPTVYPPSEVLQKLQYIKPLGEMESLYQRLWDEVKAATVE